MHDKEKDNTALLTVLIANIDKVVEQNEKLAERIGDIDVTLARLTTTVEVHEKRSNSLEGIQKSCQVSCEAQIRAALDMAEEAQETWKIMRAYSKTLAVLIGIFVSIISVIAAVTQILEFVAKK